MKTTFKEYLAEDILFENEINELFANSILEEGLIDDIKSQLTDTYNVFKSIKKIVFSNNKNPVNDKLVFAKYEEEKAAFQKSYNELPDVAKKAINPVLQKYNINILGANAKLTLDRSSGKRIVILKLLGFLVFKIKDFKDDQITAIIDLIVAGLGTAIKIILEALDDKKIGAGIVNFGKFIKEIYVKAKEWESGADARNQLNAKTQATRAAAKTEREQQNL